MRTKVITVKKSSKKIRVIEEDRRLEYGVDNIAERVMEKLQNQVSPILYGMLVQQLLAFHEDMQLEMADNLVLFARDHEAHFTGCPSADTILDTSYIWIAREHGFAPSIKSLRPQNYGKN